MILAKPLIEYGIGVFFLNKKKWELLGICFYGLKTLTNRKQRVVINGKESSWKTVNAGVPQGSILGTLLFLIFINDIVDEVNCPIKLFADDTSIYAIVDNPLITSLSLNSHLQKVQNWSNRWLVNFNPKKTESMIFHERSSLNSILHFILIMFPLKM